jgi:hypothetical protein
VILALDQYRERKRAAIGREAARFAVSKIFDNFVNRALTTVLITLIGAEKWDNLENCPTNQLVKRSGTIWKIVPPWEECLRCHRAMLKNLVNTVLTSVSVSNFIVRMHWL